jgi:hypothetical protein
LGRRSTATVTPVAQTIVSDEQPRSEKKHGSQDDDRQDHRLHTCVERAAFLAGSQSD